MGCCIQQINELPSVGRLGTVALDVPEDATVVTSKTSSAHSQDIQLSQGVKKALFESDQLVVPDPPVR